MKEKWKWIVVMNLLAGGNPYFAFLGFPADAGLVVGPDSRVCTRCAELYIFCKSKDQQQAQNRTVRLNSGLYVPL